MNKQLRADVMIESNGKRLDIYLSEVFSIKRVKAQDAIKNGRVTVDGKIIKKPSMNLRSGQVIILDYEEEKKASLVLRAQEQDLDIYYEDDDIIVLCKPRGMVVYPSVNHPSGTLVNALLAHTTHLSNLSGAERPGIVHRLDKDTSGLMVIAKSNFAHKKLVDGFSHHDFSRFYEGVVYGKPQKEKAKIILPLARDKKYRTRMAVDKDGKEAITNYWVRESNKKFSLVNFSLETGRTHQIRVHMAYIGHSLYGDSVYGGKKNEILNGQALHAYKLIFIHPRTGETIIFKTPKQDYLKSLCDMLELNYKEGDEEFVK